MGGFTTIQAISKAGYVVPDPIPFLANPVRATSLQISLPAGSWVSIIPSTGKAYLVLAIRVDNGSSSTNARTQFYDSLTGIAFYYGYTTGTVRLLTYSDLASPVRVINEKRYWQGLADSGGTFTLVLIDVSDLMG